MRVRTAVVTGGTRAIGHATVQALTAAGFVARSRAALVRAADSLRSPAAELAGRFKDYPLHRIDLQWQVNARAAVATTQRLSQAAAISFHDLVSMPEREHGMSATAISLGYLDDDSSAWVHSRVDPSTIRRPYDIAELVRALTRMTRWVVMPHADVTRPGPNLWRA